MMFKVRSLNLDMIIYNTSIIHRQLGYPIHLTQRWSLLLGISLLIFKVPQDFMDSKIKSKCMEKRWGNINLDKWIVNISSKSAYKTRCNNRIKSSRSLKRQLDISKEMLIILLTLKIKVKLPSLKTKECHKAKWKRGLVPNFQLWMSNSSECSFQGSLVSI